MTFPLRSPVYFQTPLIWTRFLLALVRNVAEEMGFLLLLSWALESTMNTSMEDSGLADLTEQRLSQQRQKGPRQNQPCHSANALIHCCCSVAKSCPTLCDPINCNMPVFPVLLYLLEFAQTHHKQN